MPPKRKASHLTDGGGDAASEPGGALRRSTRRKAQPATAVKDEIEGRDVAKKNGTITSKAAAVGSKTKGKAASAKTKHGEVKASSSNTTAGSSANNSPADPSEKSYWLMKAEPESRFENGTDVRFSIDDLASRTEPEPWDGIRNYVARNNLRAMKKGELAFFYHSNCKEPGIVGTMEIVEEHSPDLSAQDPKAPYHDASSKPDNPKWSVVHVQFRSKFAEPILLKELREMGKPGQPLENMQLLKQSRLSVSRVSPAEWEYLMSVANKKGGETG
ncbi:hypothetical protein SLS62_003711 [Diatrype stigma]|uniref:Thymocyte nuclear protein 1 n=1 Tax=Diatrype stigma TaxID=117547 RepID=A0AAN9UWB5_9PEZI